MNRPSTLRAAVALIAVTAAGLLTGCTAQPSATPADAAAAAPASATGFRCPAPAEVAALTATPFSSGTAGAGACSYATGADAAASSTVTVQRLAASDGRTAAALRYTAMRGGAVTADVPALAFDAFSAATSASCTVWFPVAGVPTSVTARQDGVDGAKECGVAGAVATLVGNGSASSSAPVVAVVAQRELLGTSTAGATWPFRIGRDAGARIDRATGTGYLPANSSTSLTAAAGQVPTDSAAVVLVSGADDAGASRLATLNAATAALSAASGRAPKAKLIVVGPVADPATSTADLDQLRSDLRSAAGIAGAVYVDPAGVTTAGTGSRAELAALADAVTARLRTDGIARG